MDILKEAKRLASSATKKASEVANDINEKLEKRKEVRELLEEVADREDNILNYLLSLEQSQLEEFPEEIIINVLAIKSFEEKILFIQADDLPETDAFEQNNVDEDVRYCTKCGKEVGATDIYCKYCGALR